MAIIRALRFIRRPWSLPIIDLGLPAGYWVAAGSDVGDASGGVMTWQHIFAAPASGVGDASSLFSIEQVAMMLTTTGAAPTVELTVLGMDGEVLDGTGNPFTHGYTFQLVDNGTSEALPMRDSAIPIWLGNHAGRPTTVSVINFIAGNPTAAVTFRCKVQGYFWAPGAINATFGIRRPQGSIYTR